MSVLKHFVCWQLGLAKAETQTTEAERACLARQALGRRCLVEVGVWHGVTTSQLRASMLSDGVLYAVDPYPPGRLGISLQRWIAQSEVGRVRNGRVEWIRKTGIAAAEDLAPALTGRIDFIFIDGDHTYEGISSDWNAWAPLVAPGGVIALHDSRPTPTRPIHESGSVRFTADIVMRDRRFQPIDFVDSVTVLSRLGVDEG